MSYLDKPEEIIPQVVPQNLNSLEYELLSRIYRMTMTDKPKVVVVAPYEVKQQDPRMQQYLRQMGQDQSQKEDRYKNVVQMLQSENYDVVRSEMTQSDPLPADFNLLLVLSPQNLSDRQRYEINKALVEGKDVIMGVQNYKFDYMPQRGAGIKVMPQQTKPQVNDLLAQYGLAVNDEILMDNNQEMLSIPTQQTIGGFLKATVQTPVKLPIQIKITDQEMNTDVSITNRVGALLYLWGSSLNIDQQKLAELGLTDQVLFSSSNQSWTIPFGSTPLTPTDIDMNQHQDIGAQPLAVMVSGQFPNVYENMPPPAWPGQADSAKATAPENIEAKPGKLILIGAGEMFTDQIIQAAGNGLLILNSVDAMLLGDDLVNVRTKQMTARYIEETSAASKVFWRFFVIVLIPLVLIAIGIARFIMRRNRRETYQRLLSQAG